MSTTYPTTTEDTRKGQRPMGASRDYTTGHPSGATAVMDRAETVTTPGYRSRTLTQPSPTPARSRPRRSQPTPTTGTGRLGSKQVVSVRGRRTLPTRKVSLFKRLSIVAIALLIAGVAAAMWLSGLATQQTFRIQTLTAQDAALSNEIETLNRDLANVSSTAEIARQAHDMGMGVPNQEGILETHEPGDTVEIRPAEPGVSPIIDVNGAPVRPGQASSDPMKTEEISERLQAIPSSQAGYVPSPPAPPARGVAPYAAGSTPGDAPSAPLVAGVPGPASTAGDFPY